MADALIGFPLKKLPGFRRWLEVRGAEFFPSEHPYCVMRFGWGREAGVAWTNKGRKVVSAANLRAESLFSEWRHGAHGASSWAVQYEPRNNSRDMRRKKAVALRDGSLCFYCGDRMGSTLEHVVPRAHGGPDHLSNLVLACVDCNHAVGMLSAREKVRYRDDRLRRGAATRLERKP